MASVQDRMKLKHAPRDTWSTREQLCLAASVLHFGESIPNWKTISDSLKPFAEKEALRPPDWFSQKSCAVQYSHLLETADTPKRKKRESGESSAETIVSRLTQERIAELKQILAFQRDEYQQLKAEVNVLTCGPLSDEKLQKMWQAIEQEEREQEQKARAHAIWLAKRQQKQDSVSAQSISVQRKSGDDIVENNDMLVTETLNTDEDDKKQGGRSPLLTSLLKSPSPTTQVQTTPLPTQVATPTIASLLGSSPKVPASQLDRGLTQNVSSQLQQLVSTAIASVAPERPSTGAPTLSMLLELPANSQRGSVTNLQLPTATPTPTSARQQIHAHDHGTAVHSSIPTTSQNLIHMVQPPPAQVSQNIPATESMVQIIDHIDEVIGKDRMTEVIDKDEINEIIGDIEELIKEDTTASPRTETPTIIPAVESVPVQQPQEIIPERSEPRDVDEPISMSDSPESEMAIGEIDSSTSNIAEIIGTVAVESTDSKILTPRDSPTFDEKNSDESDEPKNSPVVETEPLPEETSISPEPRDEPVKEEEPEAQVEDDEGEVNDGEALNAEDEDESTLPETVVVPKLDKDVCNKEIALISAEKEDTRDSASEEKEMPEDTENKEELKLDQLEIDLAEITGDQQDTPTEVAPSSVASDTTNDMASIEDTEKSQDISIILEDDGSSHSSQNVDKAPSQELTTESIEHSKSSQEESATSTEEEADVIIKVDLPASVEEEFDAKTTDSQPEVPEQEDTKDASQDSATAVADQTDITDEETSETSQTDSNPSALSETMMETVKPECTSAIEPVKTEDALPIKDEVEETVEKIETRIQSEAVVKEDLEIKETKVEEQEETEEKPEPKETVQTDLIAKKEHTTGIGEDGELEEEESTLSKMSGSKTMKTYSKRQAVTVDSETEAEGGGEGADYRAWKKAVMLVFNRLVTHKYASVFLRPITEDQAPGYHSVIFRPMDLSTIKKNIDNGTIRSTMHFQRDVMLMFQNAIMYNKQDTFIYKMAVSMQEECLQHMQILVQVTGEGPFRRETRTATSSTSDLGDVTMKPQRKRSHITPSPHDSENQRIKKRRKSEND